MTVDAERQPEPIREGDVLVLEHPGHVSYDGIINIREGVADVLPGVKVLILEEGMKAKLLRPEAARGLED